MIEGSINGLGKEHLTPIFPCGIFQVKAGVSKNPCDPNYDLFEMAIKSTVKRIYPNYVNCDFSGQKAWVAADRKAKEDVINNLSEEKKAALIERLKVDEEVMKNLTLSVTKEGEIKVTSDELPCEAMSTMGKRNTTAHLKSFEPYQGVCMVA